jgi:next-to-BRCA1 protein 1
MGEDRNGAAMTTMGDVPARRSTATETVPVAPSANAATQVQTIVDMKPVEARQSKPKIEIKDLLAEPIQEKIRVQDLLSTPLPVASKPKKEKSPTAENRVAVNSELNACFVRETIEDGTKVAPESRFVQVWTLRNPGPQSWPAGCSVRYVGGDNMLNVDSRHPSSESDLAEATETNVIGRPVEKGEEISFRVFLKAPVREGTHISYWRLKSPSGTPFGHRLWCHIEVSESATSAPASPPALSVSSTANDFQSQLMLLEEMSRRNVQKCPMLQAQASFQSTSTEPTGAATLADRKVALRKAVELSRARAEQCRKAQAAVAEVKTEEAEVKAEQKTEPATEEAPVKEEPTQELRSKGSVMIFPQLPKESPASSVLNIKPATEETKVESTPSENSEEDFFEDAESVDILDGSSDDGFLTDEEYDILDASDEEQV